MSDSIDAVLLDYYQRELTWLRHAGADFAERFPKIAHRLELSEYECPDPHIERLLEGFAFLNARLQRQLDDDFSQLSSALLEELYPYAIRPMPSTAIACFQADASKGNANSGLEIKRGTSLFVNHQRSEQETDSIYFRTTAPLTVWPLQIDEAILLDAEEAQKLTGLAKSQSALKIRIHCNAAEGWPALTLSTLKVHLAGSPLTAAALYDLLGAHSIAMFSLLKNKIAPIKGLPEACGFTDDEALLPSESGALASHRMLLEYFSCPAKFAFFELPISVPAATEHDLEIIIAFNTHPASRLSLQASDLALGCVPVINLFPRTSEPLRPSGKTREYRIVADSHREHATEIYAIGQVRASKAYGAQIVPRYFGLNHTDANGCFWHARRVDGVAQRRGSDMLLTWVNANFLATDPPAPTLSAELLCTNRFLAESLAAGTVLAFEQPGPVAKVRLMASPTPQLPYASAAQWRLVSQLSLNHLSLIEGPQALAALREILNLYNVGHSASTQQQIAGIRSIQTQRTVDRVGKEAWRGWRNGLEVRLELDANQFAGSSRVLFSGVLAQFFAQYASVNRFIRTVLVEKDREIKTWQPLVGDPLIL
jgi:type VI secretion system protein ImpG